MNHHLLPKDEGFHCRVVCLSRKKGVSGRVIQAIQSMRVELVSFIGDSAAVSAITTLTYNCPCSAFFEPHAIGRLKLVNKGAINTSTKGAKHVELGHMQLLPGKAARNGVDANGDGKFNFHNVADPLASTANFLTGKS